MLLNAHKARPKAGGEWFTVERISKELGESYKWVKRRVAEHADLAEERQDDHGVPRVHYPPSIIASLREEKRERDAYPAAEDHLVISGIAKALGKSLVWVKKNLPQTEIAPEIRLDGKGRPAPHYPPQVVEHLRDMIS